MAIEEIGRVGGRVIKWNHKTGEVYVCKRGLFSDASIQLAPRAAMMIAAFALAEGYLRRMPIDRGCGKLGSHASRTVRAYVRMNACI